MDVVFVGRGNTGLAAEQLGATCIKSSELSLYPGGPMAFTTWITAVDSWEAKEKENTDFCMALLERAVDAANKKAAAFIFLSTYSVYAGRNPRAVDEDEATEPLNAYSRWKLNAEQAVLAKAKKPFILRCADLYGGQKGLAWFQKTYAKAAIDIHCNPLHVQDLVKACIDIAQLEPEQQVFNIGGPEFMSKYEWVRHFKPGVLPCLADDLKLAAPRPRFVNLDCSRLRKTIDFKPITVAEAAREERA
ncbi:MAG: sugar nucleotide-binding protein [Nanoarchaeota archaeon]